VYASSVVSVRNRDALGVFAVALFARLAIVVWAHARFPPAEDGRYYDALARRLAAGAGYTWLWPDGAVTYAAHYPVGYPALLACAYVVFGASTAAAMSVNALFGAISAVVAHRLVDGPQVSRWRPLAAGLSVALHPALVSYTAAVMTEGVTASLLLVAVFMTFRSRDGTRWSWSWLAGAGVAMGVATLVRPTSILFVPLWGMLSTSSRNFRPRLLRSAAIMTIALACVLPWTIRNCVHMHRCALVSLNGGWNLLIGVETRDGAWMPISVPSACAAVWDEAGKDACFEREARRMILTSPAAWLARAPAKIAATFDYVGAGPSYLAASNPYAFGDRDRVTLGAIDTIVCRGFLVAALIACGTMVGPRVRSRKLIAFLGAACSMTLAGWLGYVALVACALLAYTRTADKGAHFVVMATAVVIGVTVLVHSAFIGAGRYALIAVPFVAMVPFCPFGVRKIPTGCANSVSEADCARFMPFG